MKETRRTGCTGRKPCREAAGLRIAELPREERPRERLLQLGPDRLSNAELLAILIGCGTKRQSALMLASRLLAEGEGLAFLAGCHPEELVSIKGIGRAKAARVLAAAELGKRLAEKKKENRPDSLHCADQAAQFLMPGMRYLKKEHFRTVLLNVKNQVLSVENVAVGGLSSAKIHPREVFCAAIRKSAASIILTHNHPSGDPMPSESDVDLTARLVEAGHLLGIPVLDHIVIGDGTYVSMKESFLM